MKLRRTSFVLAAALAALPTRALADGDAQSHAERAQALYNIGKFPEAAAELEAAYELDPSNTRVLFNLAQAYRMAGNLERAAFVLRRYLEDPRADEKPEAQRRLADIEAELKVGTQQAAANKATADELARTKAELASAQAELAALKTPQPETWHVALEYGSTMVYIVGAHTRTGTTHGRIRAMYVFHHGGFTLEHGGVWTVIPIPYTASDGSGVNAIYSTFTYDVEARRQLSPRWWTSGGLGVGFGAFGHMKTGNPFGMNGAELADTGSLVVRADLMFGFRWSKTVSSVIETAITASTTPDGFRDSLAGPFAYDLFSIGLHVMR